MTGARRRGRQVPADAVRAGFVAAGGLIAAGGLVVAAAIAAVLVAACQPATATASPHTATDPAPSVAAPTAVIAPSPAASSIEVDESLLEILPADVDGVAIESEPSSAGSVARDPALLGEVEAIAIGLAVDPASQGANLAIASVVRLVPGVFNDAFFRNWRDSYDEAACAQAGGVVGNAEAQIGGRQVFIGSCTGGAHTYHVVARDGIIVSVTAVGERRLGEKIVEDLRG